MNINILVVEDDDAFRNLIKDILKKEGYNVILAKDGQEGLELFFSKNIDIVILDIMMPVYNGIEVLEQIRKQSNVFVIMLTALGEEQNEILGFELGADEYISKPFSYPIFISRVKSLVKRLEKYNGDEIKIGDISINENLHKIFVKNKEITLNLKEFNLLLYFMKNKNMVLTRDNIFLNVWGYDFDKDIRTIDTHVKTLRAKLGVCSNYIKTVRGVGYKFEN